MSTLALLHTTAVTVAALGPVAKRELPGVRVVNLLDDSLLADVIAAGHVPAAVADRMAAYVAQATCLGADAVLCCCSSVGEVTETIAAAASVRVWRIDQAMAEEAARIAAAADRRAGRIGVLATVETTLGPTSRLVARVARGASVEARVVPGAFDLLQAGRTDEHDARVGGAIAEMARGADVVVLAQASMERVLAAIAPPVAPVLTSPLLAFARVRALLSSGS